MTVSTKHQDATMKARKAESTKEEEGSADKRSFFFVLLSFRVFVVFFLAF